MLTVSSFPGSLKIICFQKQWKQAMDMKELEKQSRNAEKEIVGVKAFPSFPGFGKIHL